MRRQSPDQDHIQPQDHEHRLHRYIRHTGVYCLLIIQRPYTTNRVEDLIEADRPAVGKLLKGTHSYYEMFDRSID